MSSRRFRGVLLCEDKEHESFFRRLLERLFGRGRFRVERIPNREGAGDAYVLANYAREVQYARSRHFENYALVVAIDGDREKLHGRLRQLDEKLEENGLSKRTGDDMIVICVPTRNVETWELWLCGDRDLDEETDYKWQFREAVQRGEASTKIAARTWFDPLSEKERRLEESTLPALAAGRAEIQRLRT